MHVEFGRPRLREFPNSGKFLLLWGRKVQAGLVPMKVLKRRPLPPLHKSKEYFELVE